MNRTNKIFEPIFKHKQVPALTPEGSYVEVDEGMASFLSLLWSEGYRTMYSCQEDNRGSYIMFLDIEDAERFQKNYGGELDQMIYNGNRRCVRRFDIPSD